MTKKARNDGERRTALFAQTIVHVDRGQMSKALAEADKQYSVAEKNADAAAMAGDLNLKGNILLEMGKAAEAGTAFDSSLKTIEGSNLSEEIKANNRRVSHFNRGRVAIAKKDLATAKTEAEEFRKGAEASKNPAQIRLSHELDGMIALAEKDYDKAVAEFQQGNQQNPQNLYRLCEAYKGKGDAPNAKQFCKQAADFNSLPQLNYAFVRTKAKAEAAKG
jgi:tetratricopeptide (TPR) repeat protein